MFSLGCALEFAHQKLEVLVAAVSLNEWILLGSTVPPSASLPAETSNPDLRAEEYTRLGTSFLAGDFSDESWQRGSVWEPMLIGSGPTSPAKCQVCRVFGYL